MSDGFFKGELNGTTGLVPSNFVQLLLDQTDATGPGSYELSGTYPRNYVALFDYNPVEQSPNDNPETELSFHEGDLITVTGPMDEVRVTVTLCDKVCNCNIVLQSGM